MKKSCAALVCIFSLGLCSPSPAAELSKVIHELKLDELHQAAPDFSYEASGGKILRLSSFKGKAVLLHFWASWCEPCQKELPELIRFSKLLDERRWVFLPVSVDVLKDRAAAAALIDRTKSKIPLNFLSVGADAEKYRTWGLPATYFIDPQGEIVARALGCKEWMQNPAYANDLNGLFSISSKTNK